MLLQVAIAIASSMALVLALLLRTGMGTSRDWGKLKGEAVSAAPAGPPPAEALATEALFVAPAAMRARRPAAEAGFAVAAEPQAIPETHARQRIRIGAVSLELPEGKEVTVLQDDNGTLTVLIEATGHETSGIGHVEPDARGRNPPSTRTEIAGRLETVPA